MDIFATMAIFDNYYKDLVAIVFGTINVLLELPFLAIGICNDYAETVVNRGGEFVFTCLMGCSDFGCVELIFAVLHKIIVRTANNSVLICDSLGKRTFAATGAAAKNDAGFIHVFY